VDASVSAHPAPLRRSVWLPTSRTAT